MLKADLHQQAELLQGARDNTIQEVSTNGGGQTVTPPTCIHVPATPSSAHFKNLHAHRLTQGVTLRTHIGNL